MASDLTPTAEGAMIEAYIRVCAPGVHDLSSCGTRLDGGYEVWFRLNPTSERVPIVISKAEYKEDRWKEKIDAAIEDANI